MRHFAVTSAAIALLASTTAALSLKPQEVLLRDTAFTVENLGSDPEELRTIETAPGETQVVTEARKWQLKRDGVNFIDITDHLEFHNTVQDKSSKSYKYPAKPKQQKIIKPLLANLTAANMQKNLEKFTSFYTRYYRSTTGRESSEWLLGKVNETASVNSDIHVAPFIHKWGQNSVIAHIPPGNYTKSENVDVTKNSTESKTHVVIGAHQDSVNMYLPMFLRSPGADDDGSGTVTILEAFRVLVESDLEMRNPVEFHWYSAEEGGLLGSQDIFTSYSKNGVDVGAMLQQDMTGYVQGTLDAGKPESVGVITDYVDSALTDFIKKIVTEYCDVPYTETLCGYACSDHASASKAGYPSAFVIESDFSLSDQHIHTNDDTIEYLSFDHMLQHAKMTLALAIELGLADLE